MHVQSPEVLPVGDCLRDCEQTLGLQPGDVSASDVAELHAFAKHLPKMVEEEAQVAVRLELTQLATQPQALSTCLPLTRLSSTLTAAGLS